MNKVFSMIITGLFFSWLLLQPVLAQDAGGPKLVVPEMAHDFGKVKEGAVVEHAFQVLNKGDQPILIEKVQPG